MAKPKYRTLIVNDSEGRWFVRRVFSVVHDLENDHKVYHCDKHLGGPYDTLFEAYHLVGADTHAPRKART